MAVLIGSARIDENGKAHGGQAGDQTGHEVETQNWYLHSKGWICMRPKSETDAEKIAEAMEKACANPLIGYDQYQRNTLYNAAKNVGFDPSRITQAVETDCSALVRVCCAYAGIILADFNTYTEAKILQASGKFEKLTGAKYTTKSDYLKRGDILVTKTKGHTVVVLSDGPSAVHYFPVPAIKTVSIVDALNSIGADWTFAYRVKIALANGISNYKGTAVQNQIMRIKLYAGTLIKPE